MHLTVSNPLIRLAWPVLALTLAAPARADYYTTYNDTTNLIGGISRCDDAGTVIGTFGENVLYYPISVAFDKFGVLYVGDYGNGKVQRFLPDGTWVGEFADVGDQISSIAFHPDGSLLVSRYVGGAVWRFAADGTPLGEFVADTGFQRNGQMAFDAAGNFYIPSWTESTINQYDTDGNYLGVFSDTDKSGIYGPTGIAFDAFGQMVVTEYTTYGLKLLDGGGFLAADLGATFGEPEYVTVEADGTYLIPYFYLNTVHRFAADGTDLGEFTTAPGPYQTVKGAYYTVPDGYTRLRGKVDSGGVESLWSVDADVLRVCRFVVANSVEPPVQVKVHGTLPVSEASTLSVWMTSRMASNGFFKQELIMIDENGVESPTMRRTDTVNTGGAIVSLQTDDAASFIGDDGSVSVRYNVRPSGPVSVQLWCHEADQILWTAAP
ncbi:MAG: NHL repeat-containing protein [Armatimonadetes bacterium]|nr:NHL repeat-containing protein [Armatimonadota bacterium]